MKKTITIILALVMSLMLVLSACNGGSSNSSSGETNSGSDTSSGNSPSGETISLKVWGSQEAQGILAEMIESFKAQNSDKTFNIELGVVSEGEASTRYLEDPSAAADVFAFAHDQLKTLVTAGALYEITGRWKDTAIADNVAGSIDAATRDGRLYAFPMTADNGYFMYYDSSVFSADDVQSLDRMLEVAAAANKKVYFDLANGWYISSFFLAAGCEAGLDDNNDPFCNFNNENGVRAGEAIKAFTSHSGYIGGSDEIFTGGIGTTVAAGVSGTWNSGAAKEKLGDNYAASKLPTFTMNGNQVQLSSFAGYKLMGVNRQTAHAQEAMDLAAWLTNYDNQMKRFDAQGFGPSNARAGSSAAVQASPELAALSAQEAHAVVQNDLPDNYWEPLAAFGTHMISGDATDVKTLLDEMVSRVLS